MELTHLLPAFGNTAFTLLAFVVALSIIVAVHEYGHYIVGRWSGIKAEVFSIGFGPVLWSRSDRHGTRWQIAALPFGGYVKFLGDANAASVGGDMAHVPPGERRRTMMGAPLRARAATVIAGPAFNFALSLVLFAGVIMWQGILANPVRIAALAPLPPGLAGDLKPGDEIVAVAGVPLGPDGSFAIPEGALPPGPLVPYTVRRDGAELTVPGPTPFLPVVGALAPNSAAYDVEMKVGDVILSVDGSPVYAFSDLVARVSQSGGRALLLEVWRDGQRLTFSVVPRRQDLPLPDGGFETRWLIGIIAGQFFTPDTVTPGPIQALGMAAGQVWFIITSSLSGLWHIVTGAISTCNLSGPVGIAQTSGAMASQGASDFIWFVAVLSTAVGLLNLFPVPMLDGGHLVFYAWEGATGRPPGERALRVLMAAGLTLILALMVFALANDLFLCP